MLGIISRNRICRAIFSQRALIRSATTQTTVHSNVIEEKPNTNNDEPIDIKNPFEQEKQKCILCRMNITPNYKNVKLLSQFQSPYTGRIYGRHITGLCKRKQDQIENEIIKAQHCALMPYYHKAVEFMRDPKLFNPEKPIRPHKY